MNAHANITLTHSQTRLTKSQQRLKELLGITDRALTAEESDELYHALHADYMRAWRLAKAEQLQREGGRFVQSESRKHELELLSRTRAELAA